jgi:tRNA (cmo5U34)-methyltransferase
MTNSTAATFNAHASTYDEQRRRLIRCYDDFYGTAVDALGARKGTGPFLASVLDLGAGTGLLSRHIRKRYPDVELTLTDSASAMLDGARRQFGDSATYVEADLTGPLPDGRWDAIASALAIHHLSDDDKRALFARIQRALEPGGVFVNAEQVAGATPYFETYNEAWQKRGVPDADWAAALDRMKHDRCATVEDQLAWLREAGFEDADCLFKHHRFAVFLAIA